MDSIQEEDKDSTFDASEADPLTSSTPMKSEDSLRLRVDITQPTPSPSHRHHQHQDNSDETSSQSSLPLTDASSLSRMTLGDEDGHQSPSLNDDLFDTRSSLLIPSNNHLQTRHKRNFSFSSSSIMTRHSFDDSGSISLGENKISAPSISPLGQNSIYELVSGADKLRRKQGKIWINVNNGTTKVSARGPTTSDIPPVHLSKIEKVPNNDLKKYIQDIYEEYKNFNSNRQLTQATLDTLMAETKDDYKSLEEDLKNIPDFYFDNQFQLDDPRTFSKMTENSDILLKNNVGDNNKALTNNNLLQEKLSWYLDTVEIHLINEISKSSNSFFSALDDLKEITSKSRMTGDFLVQLDDKFAALDLTKASVAVNLMKKIKKRQNVALLENSLIQIKLAMKLPDIAEDFYYKSHYQLSLDFMDLFHNVIRGNMEDEHVRYLIGDRFKLIDISSLPALENLKSMVHKLRADIGLSYINLFIDFLLTDLRTQYETISRQDSLDRITFSVSRESKRRSTLDVDSKKINNSYQTVDVHFNSEVSNYMFGLLRCHNLITSFQEYRKRLVPEVKSIIRDHLPNSTINDQDSTTSSLRPGSMATSATSAATGSKLGNDLRAMTPKEFEDMLVEIYTKLAECLRRLTTQQKALLNIALEAISSSNDPTYQDHSELIIKLDISNTINQCIDKVQERMTKIIAVRRDQTIKLTVPFFLKFYSINNLFSHECESISGSTTAVSIKEAVNHYTRQYIQNFPNLQARIIQDYIDREIWKDVPLPMNLQTSVNEIIESAEEDPTSWLDSLKWNNLEESAMSTNAVKFDSDDDQRKTVVIDQKSFIVPAVATHIIRLIKEFLLLKTIFQQNTPQLQQNLLEILKDINDRTKLQVLSANVKRTTDLKHITSKHLSITSQLLACIIALIPYIQRSFERSLRQDEFMNESFENLILEYKDHQSQIYAKLISLMNDRVQLHSRAIATIDWSDPVKDKPCHPYMESLVKETTTISRVLQRYLPEIQVSMMLSQIFDNYKTTLIGLYSKLEIKDSIQKLIILKDIDYFRVNLSDLIGYGQSGQMIWETVNNLDEKEG